MFTRLSGNVDTLNRREGMVQLGSMLLIPPFHRSPPHRDPPIRTIDPLHPLRIKRQQIKPPTMLMLRPAIRDATHRRREVRRDFAGVHGGGEDGGSEVNRGVSI